MRRMLLIIISAIAAFALAACTGNNVDESTSKIYSEGGRNCIPVK